MNTDLKLFTKMLANRLLPLVQRIVHADQVGFVPTREAKENTVRALNVIHHFRSQKRKAILLSTDAEKVFDRVDWTFYASDFHPPRSRPDLF